MDILFFYCGYHLGCKRWTYEEFKECKQQFQKGVEKMKQYYSNHGSYRELLFDERWREKRMHILERDGYKCTICGSEKNLVVHHKQYHIDKNGRKLRPWEYNDKYLITLCSSCHQRGHAKFDIPTKTINKYGTF